MYQIQYAKKGSGTISNIEPEQNISDVFHIDCTRDSVWEEHCLECSAPSCYRSCENYVKRQDGRCARFYNGIEVHKCPAYAKVKFRAWGNMMSVVYPGYHAPHQKSGLFAKLCDIFLKKTVELPLNSWLKWGIIRPIEFLLRQALKRKKKACSSDAFVLHAYSMQPEPFQLILEVYRDNTPVYKTGFSMQTGENLHVLPSDRYSPECDIPGNLIKIYPENNLNAEIVFLFNDFVKGHLVEKLQPDSLVKCVVWDLDCTVWDGILVETENPEVLALRENIMDTIIELDRRGILQSVASKNDETLARPQLERLGIGEYFLYPQISWGPKSEAIKSISKHLNIGIDSFAFVDDSTFERNQVLSALPQVRVYDEREIFSALSTLPFSSPVTAEGHNRRRMYISEAKRREDMNARSDMDISEFIRACEIEVEIFPPQTEEEIVRCFELIQRTNQLNISGKKYNKNAFSDLLKMKDRQSFALRCRDKYGDYGIVGFMQYEMIGEELIFREFAMSCRVAGRHIESALLNFIKQCAKCKSYRFPVKITSKNRLLRDTLSEVGCLPVLENNDEIEFSFDEALKWSDDVAINSRIQ